MGPVLNERLHDFAHDLFFRFCDITPRGLWRIQRAILAANPAQGNHQSPWGEIAKISDVQNHVIFHLRPVPSKNIEK